MRPIIYVETGVSLSLQSLSQKMNDAIKIGVELKENIDPNNCHFLQFITRQSPCVFLYEIENKVCWENADTHYMVEPQLPKWRLDSASHPKAFYEIEGASIIDGSQCCILDQPDYAIKDENGKAERIIGCTFVIVNEQVVKEVRWSRQYEIQPNGTSISTYRYSLHDVDELPDWALLTLKNEYKTNELMDDLVYDIPNYLQKNNLKDKFVAIRESTYSFLPPPDNWYLLQHNDFKKLYSNNSGPAITNQETFFRPEEQRNNITPSISSSEERVTTITSIDDKNLHLNI